MGHSVTLGGERLGGGKKNKVHLHGYERSTHNMSYAWRSTMACGTLVPFMVEVALPGDTFDIDLEVDVLTHPTIGPLFGTYKVHLDVFQVPLRLYQAQLHMNALGIGLDMSKVLLPQIVLRGNDPNWLEPIDNQQIASSCIMKYLGIAGMGTRLATNGQVERQFNAVPWIAYWDIYKNYYSNKQEGIGVVIHQPPTPYTPTVTSAQMYDAVPTGVAIPVGATPAALTSYTTDSDSYLVLQFTAGQLTADFQLKDVQIQTQIGPPALYQTADTLFRTIEVIPTQNRVIIKSPKQKYISIAKIVILPSASKSAVSPKLLTFPLVNIDNMRMTILQKTVATALIIDNTTPLYGAPYDSISERFRTIVGPPETWNYSIQYSQEGLGIRTYASDLFNNWINTDTIDGVNGITAVTAVNVSGGKFTIDELNLSKKVYEMLNRIAISGGTYDDWLDAVYDHDRQRSAENPIYLGGLIRNLVFQEVISNSATADEPLGTLAGRGKIGGLDKGGKIIAKIDEPSYLIGLVSIVPNIDYSQGNKWDVNLQNINELHKPALDEIGFQNLITDQMAWFDTQMTGVNAKILRSAGKQPAWMNYMTNVNKVYGGFADEQQQMFMVLNRRYEPKLQGGTPRIQDLTTYIDPMKFNHIFADTDITAQNYWVQIGVGMEVRRKMSAKVVPNL